MFSHTAIAVVFLVFSAVDLAAQGPVSQPDATPVKAAANAKANDNANTPQKPATPASQDDSASLLNSPDAREAAEFKCAAFVGANKATAASALQGNKHPPLGACALGTLLDKDKDKTSTIGDILTTNLNQPLKDGANADTDLAKAVKLLLKTITIDKDKKQSILSSQVPYVAIHLIDAQKLRKPAPSGAGAGSPRAQDSQQAAGGPPEGGDQKVGGGLPTPGAGGAAPESKQQAAGGAAPGSDQQPANSQTSKTTGPGQRWILAHRPLTGSVELSEDTRIMGTKSLGVIFVIVNATIASGLDPTAQGTQPYTEVTYNAIVKSKLPINVQNLLGLIQVIAGVATKAQGTTPMVQVAYLGWGTLAPVANPGDITVFGVAPAQDKPAEGAQSYKQQLFGQPRTFDNEGKHYWDVSVGVPVNKLSMLDYSQDTSQYLPKTINKQSVYGLLNIYVPAVDIKSTKLQYYPHIVAGPGLTGRPGENFMVGAAWGIPEVQFFVGSGFANHNVLKAGADPTKGTSFEQRYASRLTFGINVPVMAAIKKLQAKSGATPAAANAGSGAAKPAAAANQ